MVRINLKLFVREKRVDIFLKILLKIQLKLGRVYF